MQLKAESTEQSIVELIQEGRKKIISLVNSDYFTARLHVYLNTMQQEGVPFDDYQHEPGQVRQIKDLINALYHAEVIASKFQNWEIVSNMGVIYDSAVKAAHHLIYLDLDMLEVFAPEIQLVYQQYLKASALLNDHGQNIQDLAQKSSKIASAYEIGKIAGTAIQQLNPEKQRPDYPFLTEFSASLPGYIQVLTESIGEYSKTVAEIQPHLQQEKIDGLKQGAVNLLNSITTIQQSPGILLPFHLLHYIAILKEVATLATATFEEIGLMNKASQDLVAANIHKLKLELLPKLFAELDKVEDQCLLRPGRLSNPLMDQIKGLYDQLIQYASTIVDFSQRDDGLGQLNDADFKTKRVKLIQDRITESRSRLPGMELAMKDFEKFFGEIKKKNHANIPLEDLNNKTKNKLIKHYQSLQGFVEKISPELHNKIVGGLTRESAKKPEITAEKPQQSGFWSMVSNGYAMVFGASNEEDKAKDKDENDQRAGLDETNHDENTGWGVFSAVQNLYGWVKGSGLIDWKDLENQLKPFIDRAFSTTQFHIDLNKDLIAAISADLRIELKVFEAEKEPFYLDEESVLSREGMLPLSYTFTEENGVKILAANNDLKSTDAFHLMMAYKDKSEAVTEAKTAFQRFLTKIKAIIANPDSSYASKPLQKDYLCFQDYLMPGLKGSMDEQSIVNFLNAQDTHVSMVTLFTPFLDIEKYVEDKFNKALEIYDFKINCFREIGEEKYQQNPLALSTQDLTRSNFLVKHTDYSAALGRIRRDLNTSLGIFSDEIRNQLQTDSPETLPFPELEDKNGLLTEARQLVGIKSLFKMLYHLEQAALQFEKLNTTSYKATFLKHLTGVINHSTKMYSLSQILYADPHASHILHGFLEPLMSIKNSMMAFAEPYLEKPEAAVYVPDSNPIWLGMQAFNLIPEQIKASNEAVPLSAEKKSAIKADTLKMVSEIERIIKNAGSYFKMFLEIPTCYRLFSEFRRKLADFSAGSHDYALNHLKDIHEILNQLLIEADKMELNFGLKPGFLSAVLQEMFAQFYQGLLVPLNLSSKEHIGLITTFQPLLERKRETTVFNQNAWIEEQELVQVIEDLSQFIQLIDHTAADPFFKAELSRIKILYQEIYPLLVEAQTLETFDKPIDNLDDAIQKASPIATPLNQIRDRAEKMLAYKKGCKATLAFTKTAVDAQRLYLDQLIIDKQQANEDFIQKYTENVLQSVVKTLRVDKKSPSLTVFAKEYQTAFEDYLHLHQACIIQQAAFAEVIQQKVEALVLERLASFQQSELAHYEKLENLMQAIQAFEHYIAKQTLEEEDSLLFEDSGTLRAKKMVLFHLKNIALNDSLPVETRLHTLGAEIDQNSAILLKHKTWERFSFNWLIECIVDILEALHLYTPAFREQFESLADKTTELAQETTIVAELPALNRWSLFASDAEDKRLSTEDGYSTVFFRNSLNLIKEETPNPSSASSSDDIFYSVESDSETDASSQDYAVIR